MPKPQLSWLPATGTKAGSGCCHLKWVRINSSRGRYPQAANEPFPDRTGSLLTSSMDDFRVPGHSDYMPER